MKDIPADQAKWEIGQLTIPAPPPRPAMPKPENAPSGAAGGRTECFDAADRGRS